MPRRRREQQGSYPRKQMPVRESQRGTAHQGTRPVDHRRLAEEYPDVVASCPVNEALDRLHLVRRGDEMRRQVGLRSGALGA